MRVLAQRHMIDGRWCDVKVPNSKVSTRFVCFCVFFDVAVSISRKVWFSKCPARFLSGVAPKTWLPMIYASISGSMGKLRMFLFPNRSGLSVSLRFWIRKWLRVFAGRITSSKVVVVCFWFYFCLCAIVFCFKECPFMCRTRLLSRKREAAVVTGAGGPERPVTAGIAGREARTGLGCTSNATILARIRGTGGTRAIEPTWIYLTCRP